MAILYYFHDPMCSWCWGYRPTAEQLFAALPARVSRTNVLGGLAPDSDEPMPQAQRDAIAGYWRRIEDLLGTKFNHDFWTNCEPRRSTYPACRAVIAAANQGREEDMTLAIQEAYYLRAMNPSETATLRRLAEELGLDTEIFSADLGSADTEADLQRQIGFTRKSGTSGFPSLALGKDGRVTAVGVDYKNYVTTLNEIDRLLAES